MNVPKSTERDPPDYGGVRRSPRNRPLRAGCAKTIDRPDPKDRHMITITIIAAGLLAGAIVGVLVLVRLGISQENRGSPFSCEAPTRIAAAARVIAGLYVQMPEGNSDSEHATTRIDPAPHGERPL